jgi:hypothetical protein
MRNKYRIFGVIALYSFFVFTYIIFFLLQIKSIPLFLFLTIGSVAVLSTSTIYTVLHSKDSQDSVLKEKKYFAKQKPIKEKVVDIINKYIDTLPSIQKYITSNESYEKIPVIDKYIFSIFSQEELNKINLLGLSKLDKIEFIREMLYFDPNERKILVENMLKSKDKTDEEVIYLPPKNLIKIEDQLRVYIRSLVEPGEKTKIVIVNTTEFISAVKERVGILFNYNLEQFLLSSGGILLHENSQIKDYDIDDDDEIALIPSRKEKK